MCRTRNTKEPISYSLYTAIKNGPTGRKVHDICSDSRHNETRAKLRDLSAISRFTFTDRRIWSLLYIEHYHIHGFYTFPVAIMPIHFFSLCRCQMIATPLPAFYVRNVKKLPAIVTRHLFFRFSRISVQFLMDLMQFYRYNTRLYTSDVAIARRWTWNIRVCYIDAVTLRKCIQLQ